MAKNIFGKMRSIDKPYAVYRSPMGDHFILKTYKMEKNEDNFSRWFIINMKKKIYLKI